MRELERYGNNGLSTAPAQLALSAELGLICLRLDDEHSLLIGVDCFNAESA